ncbi:MAG: glycosyltransferase family 2 protein [Syntrophobacteraceae bacterium]
MEAVALLFTVIVDGITLSIIIYWSIALYRTLCILKKLPRARSWMDLAGGSHQEPSVLVVVPAHNEAGSIGRLITSLKGQVYSEMHVVLGLDRCTDNTLQEATRAIDKDQRFTVVQIDECPPSWSGKTHAVHQSLLSTPRSNTSDYLLFLDADVWLDPRFLRTAVAMAKHHGYELLSFLSNLSYRRWYEYLAQMAACIELMYQVPLLRVNRTKDRLPFANGQMMLFETSAYHRIGGHATVKDALLEDLALAGNAAAHQLRAGVLLGDGLVMSSMYDSWGRFQKGWKRIYAEVAGRRVRRLRRWSVRVLLTGCVMPLGAFAALAPAMHGFGGPHGPGLLDYFQLALPIVALAVLMTVLLLSHRTSRAPLWTCCMFPIGSWIVARLLRESAKELETKEPLEWGGRSYVRKFE